MKRIVRNLAGSLVVLSAMACTPDVNPDVRRVAAFYVERYNDSTPVDTTDSAFVPDLRITRDGLDSVTMDWTADEWEQFWAEVKKARKP